MTNRAQPCDGSAASARRGSPAQTAPTAVEARLNTHSEETERQSPPAGEDARPPRTPANGGPGRFWSSLDSGLTALRAWRQPLSLLLDGLMVIAAWNFTYLFRLGFERWLSARPDYDPLVMLCVTALYLCVFVLAQVPRAMWRFTGFGELRRVMLACFGAGAASYAAVVGLGLVEVPRAVLALHPMFTLLGVCGTRVLYRALYEHVRAERSEADVQVRRALVLGAGEAARRLLAGIHTQGWLVVGLLDDDPAKRSARIAGIPVLGSLSETACVANRMQATHLIVALPSATRAQRSRAIKLATPSQLPILTVPSADELQEGDNLAKRLRDLRPEDLLGREPVKLDHTSIAELISGRTVMITGAGGSIGSELCRQIMRYGPKRLVLIELSEFNLYQVETELNDKYIDATLVKVLADVKDLARMRAISQQWRPQIVFHAAAYKHVPLLQYGHAAPALRNNALGTYNSALCAGEVGAESFVLISTDKAVNPTSVMGASKRIAELALTEFIEKFNQTRFMAVRFGNVLGSSGSVIPRFKYQIEQGGPITVTHPDMERYFMTIPEAAGLVLQAAVTGRSGQILLLKMGEPMKIKELAEEMLNMTTPHRNKISIIYTGLRAGEKISEILASPDEEIQTTAHAYVDYIQLPSDVGPLHTYLLQTAERSPPGDEHAAILFMTAHCPTLEA